MTIEVLEFQTFLVNFVNTLYMLLRNVWNSRFFCDFREHPLYGFEERALGIPGFMLSLLNTLYMLLRKERLEFQVFKARSTLEIQTNFKVYFGIPGIFSEKKNHPL